MSSSLKHLDELRIPLKLIVAATNNFADKNLIIGRGLGFVDVYKGKLLWRPGGFVNIVVHRFTRTFVQSKLVFRKKMLKLSGLRHKSIVSILGYCDENKENIIIYEKDLSYPTLTSTQRLHICVGVAHAFSCIHNDTGYNTSFVCVKKLEHLKIQLRDIILATDNFAEECRIGSGGYGIVYKGELDHFDGKSSLTTQRKNKGKIPKRRGIVAIKRISNIEDEQGEQGFFIELEMLSSCEHPNVISLLGFSHEDPERILILSGKLAYDAIYLEENVKGLASVARRCVNEGSVEEMVDPEMKEVDKLISTLNKGPNQHSLDAFSKIAYQCLSETQGDRPTMEVVIKELQNALNFQVSMR
ncbi:hypothetical protein L6452_43439 [Arctium lappa]|uniref:Uncharacterized protein n=1 Tax=Arctium lappa TaxID=4217 RepID=A0ACB8XE51_ARCLA|nr:hypothetical protein L6452_43439 [Arctium lappa]